MFCNTLLLTHSPAKQLVRKRSPPTANCFPQLPRCYRWKGSHHGLRAGRYGCFSPWFRLLSLGENSNPLGRKSRMRDCFASQSARGGEKCCFLAILSKGCGFIPITYLRSSCFLSIITVRDALIFKLSTHPRVALSFIQDQYWS